MTLTLGDICQQTRWWAPASNETARHMGHGMCDSHVVSWRRGDWLIVVDLATDYTRSELGEMVHESICGDDLAGNNRVEKMSLYRTGGHEPELAGHAFDAETAGALIGLATLQAAS